MLDLDERIALVCALLALLVLAAEQRSVFATVLAACGIAALVGGGGVPHHHRMGRSGAEHYHEPGWHRPPEPRFAEAEGSKTDMMEDEPHLVDEGAPDPAPEAPEPAPTPTPTPAPAPDVVDDDDPWRDPQLFIADHVGALPYARFMRFTPDLQGLAHPRVGPPPFASRGRDRLARIVPIPTQSGYRDRTGQMSRFNYLH